MPKVTLYINDDYYPKWKRVKSKSALVYKALDAITEGEEMPNGTILVKKVIDKPHRKVSQ